MNIPTQNSNNGKIFYKNLKTINNTIKKYNDYNIVYKNFILHVKFNNFYYVGYIVKFDNKIKNYFSKDELNNLSKINGLYNIHGSYTHQFGFNCGHENDIKLGYTKKFTKNQTFKTHLFIESELKKTVNSIIDLYNKRI